VFHGETSQTLHTLLLTGPVSVLLGDKIKIPKVKDIKDFRMLFRQGGNNHEEE